VAAIAVRSSPVPPDPVVERTDRPEARIGALDGLRAFAVLAVVLYHFEPAWLPAGYLGVDVFMVVSGFIVTRLLVRERERNGRVRLGAFWGRRFRRLVPALLLLLAVVSLWVRIADLRLIAPSVRSQGLASLLYVTNWKLIADGVSYNTDVAGASPLVHLWSLAVEEQFYLVWPILLVALLACGRRVLAVCVAVGALASACWMAVLYEPGADPMRAYYGTDTRAQAFLLGALAALLAPLMRGRGRRLVAGFAVVALAGVAFAMFAAEDAFLYRGGFALVAVGAALLALATTLPGPVSSAFDRGPLRGVGRVSYGVYLWHWPAVVLLTPATIGIDGALLTATRVGVTAAGTGASWMLVERPFARMRPRRVVVVGVAMTAAAAFALLMLPATSIVQFGGVRTDRLQPPVVVTAPPTSKAAASKAAGPLPSTTVAASVEREPLRIALPATGTAMIVGDSGMASGAPALIAGFQAAGWGVVDTAFPGKGLTRPDGAIEDWAQTAREYDADLTVVMIGGWDVPFVEQYGEAAYRAVVERAVTAFTASGGNVLWLSTMPAGRDDDRPLDHFYAALPARHPGLVDFLEIESWLRAPDGSWPQHVDGKRFRGPDGWHLCPEGAVALAHAALTHLGLDRPGWESGDWRADPDYHRPAGICDG
jgi:peptidoglycan/LPS O-acetylase OafA/YrhL